MPIRCLTAVHYDDTGWNWVLNKTPNPEWESVVTATRRLDKFQYPWIWLFIGDNDEDSTLDCLTVVGGDGVYWVGLSAGVHDQLRLFDPEKSNREVELWTSDQGFADYEFHTTNDIEIVLQIARHFAETGQPLPSATWEV
jgi:hypothetical protein